MASTTQTIHKPASSARSRQRSSSQAFDRLYALFSLWFVGGIFLDGWAHHHVAELESFFTPWHGVLYSGFLVTTVALGIYLVQYWRQEGNWQAAVPTGYGWSLIGVLLFLAGGAGDMLWHEIFGIEESVEALLSPTHLLLAAGAVLVVTGPLRAAWQRRPEQNTWAALWPVLVATTLLLSLFTFFTQYAHPFVDAYADMATARDHGLSLYNFLDVVNAQALGVTAVLLQTALLLGVSLFILRRWQWQLPPGALTFVWTLNAVGMSVFHDEYRLIPAVFLTGLAADGWLWRQQPALGADGSRLSPQRPFSPPTIRLFSFAIPAMLYTLYFASLAFSRNIWWSVHLWLGTIILAGVTGLLLSYAFVPPAGTDDPNPDTQSPEAT